MLPPVVEDEAQLEELLSRPSPADVAFARTLAGDVLVLGAGGKMGPSLARRVRRAIEAAGAKRRVIAASRFSEPGVTEGLTREGIEAVACDLLDPASLERLPAVGDVLYLAGRKFGSGGRPDLTWAHNTVVPTHVARRFASSRIVVFSTGNVYPLVDTTSTGSVETDPPGPVGEYAQSCLGRERVFEYFSREQGTRCLLFRLNYATDLRYGVLADVARKVWAGEPVDLTVPKVNAIWQGDANSYAFRALGLAESPPAVLNVTGSGSISVRDAALHFARRFGREARFAGEEGPVALLSDAARCRERLGEREVPLDRLMEWTAAWVEAGGRDLGKPTKFERSDGRF
ncbi:MAG TPA: NAD-dependent epimerase/dehydratase family protein [Vicinamibacteria bacterium]